MKDYELKELCRISVIGFVALAVMLFIMIALSGCGSSKSSLRHESSVEENLNRTRKDSSSVSNEVTKTESEESTEEVEEVKTEYDTSKPIDPVTGKPPIKSETKKNTKKEIGKKADIKKKTQAKAAADVQISAKKKEDVVKVEDRQKNETTVPKQIEGLVWAIVVLIVVAVAAWLIIRNRRKRKDV